MKLAWNYSLSVNITNSTQHLKGWNKRPFAVCRKSVCNLSIESIYIRHFRFPKSHFHISWENELYLQEVEKLFSHQYFDLIFIFGKRAALQIFCKKTSALCSALVLKIFMFFVITRTRKFTSLQWRLFEYLCQ